MVKIELGKIYRNRSLTDEQGTYTEHHAPFETASANGVTARARYGHGAIAPLCGLLLTAGVPDQPWEAYRDGQHVLSGKSIAWMAAHDVVDDDQAGLCVIRHGSRITRDLQE